jgi:hypothetical protein
VGLSVSTMSTGPASIVTPGVMVIGLVLLIAALVRATRRSD